jgi:hypothetical protein
MSTLWPSSVSLSSLWNVSQGHFFDEHTFEQSDWFCADQKLAHSQATAPSWLKQELNSLAWPSLDEQLKRLSLSPLSQHPQIVGIRCLKTQWISHLEIQVSFLLIGLEIVSSSSRFGTWHWPSEEFSLLLAFHGIPVAMLSATLIAPISLWGSSIVLLFFFYCFIYYCRGEYGAS